MALGGSAGQGELRAAIEALLRACVEVDRQVEGVADESREQARVVARVLVPVKEPRGLADEVAGLGDAVRADLSRVLADARAPFVAEVHQLLGLLAPLHGLAPVPPLPAPAARAELSHAFPDGFAREYVGDLLNSVARSIPMELDEAEQVPIVPETAADGAKLAVGAELPDELRDECVRLLQEATCHAIERHGPQISDQAQLARLLWLKDPSGEYCWQIADDGAVETGHRCGVGSGGFTSPQAMAKPIGALLLAAHAGASTVDAYLDSNAEGMNVIGVHVSAKIAGLVNGDVLGYQAAGAGTRETKRDWIKARAYGMAEGRATVYALSHDPLAGPDPGAKLVLRRFDDGWRLVTCYPVEKPAQADVRLEDMA